MLGKRVQMGVALLFAYGARFSQVDALMTGRQLLIEAAGNLSSSSQFDAEALHSALELGQFELNGTLPTGNYTLKVRMLTEEGHVYCLGS